MLQEFNSALSIHMYFLREMHVLGIIIVQVIVVIVMTDTTVNIIVIMIDLRVLT